MGRYNSDYLNSGTSVGRVRLLYRNGMVNCRTHVLKRGERLDRIAAVEYGDSNLWWVIAAVSFIGFPSQLSPGTLIRIPTDITTLLQQIGVENNYG
tara:strand:- start:437 stop:724 length:288 start_codon:yes stop_codon:yes gene_type:complete